MEDAINNIKNTTSSIINYSSDKFDKIGDVTSNLIDFGENLGGDIITGIRSVTENPNLANAMGVAGDFLNNVGNVASNFAQSTYSILSTINYDTVKGNVKSGLSSA
jgi:hypothetical protein